MPLALSQQSDRAPGAPGYGHLRHAHERSAERIHGPDGKRFLIELHNRFAYPAACLVLMLVGVPLGVTSRRGGKSSAWVFTILLVIRLLLAFSHRHRLGRQELDSVFLAVWSANLLFAAGGIFLLWQMASGGRVLSAMTASTSRSPKPKAAVHPKSKWASVRWLLF
jgi:lipopolysaccharide export LptBFGC system permease protein LptF